MILILFFDFQNLVSERDYFPYWHPTPWIDMAVLTSQVQGSNYLQFRGSNTKTFKFRTHIRLKRVIFMKMSHRIEKADSNACIIMILMKLIVKHPSASMHPLQAQKIIAQI